jgi:Tfp pilus assembly PilM family ATPase
MTRFVEEHVENQASVVVGFSGPRSLGRTFEIPRFKSKKAEEAIAYEARMQIPIPAEDIVYDWHTWPLPDDQASFQQVTLLAARRDHVTQVVDACAGLPIKVTAIQSVCLALYNAVMAEFFSPHETSADEELSAAPVAVLDVGVDCSSLIIAAPNLVRHRSLPLGTFRWDRALMSRFKLTRQQADRLRQQPTSAQWMYQVDDVGRQAFGELAGDLRRTLRVYEGEGIQISRLLVTGGGSETFGLLRHLIHGG